MLDPALLRPGRFDYLIEIPRPGPAARAYILNRLLAELSIDFAGWPAQVQQPYQQQLEAEMKGRSLFATGGQGSHLRSEGGQPVQQAEPQGGNFSSWPARQAVDEAADPSVTGREELARLLAKKHDGCSGKQSALFEPC